MEKWPVPLLFRKEMFGVSFKESVSACWSDLLYFSVGWIYIFVYFDEVKNKLLHYKWITCAWARKMIVTDQMLNWKLWLGVHLSRGFPRYEFIWIKLHSCWVASWLHTRECPYQISPLPGLFKFLTSFSSVADNLSTFSAPPPKTEGTLKPYIGCGSSWKTSLIYTLKCIENKRKSQWSVKAGIVCFLSGEWETDPSSYTLATWPWSWPCPRRNTGPYKIWQCMTVQESPDSLRVTCAQREAALICEENRVNLRPRAVLMETVWYETWSFSRTLKTFFFKFLSVQSLWVLSKGPQPDQHLKEPRVLMNLLPLPLWLSLPFWFRQWLQEISRLWSSGCFISLN